MVIRQLQNFFLELIRLLRGTVPGTGYLFRFALTIATINPEDI